ncbi:PIN domain-containing protein [Streptomyces sp. URMC 123]|uniref:PIN domain-containing protein n=1 Tax=Streptomyces sp. URMC 123 TaxID=3423403 RepID=UPI003F1C2E56
MSFRFLVDPSAFAARRGEPVAAAVLDDLSDRGLLAVCGAVETELLHGARTPEDADRALALLRGFDRLTTPDACWRRAARVRRRLLLRHGPAAARAVPLAALVVAATAEHHGAAVLHHDGAYEAIAAVTGQPVRWVTPPSHRHAG